MGPTAAKGFNNNINHVAVSVPDLDAAVKWYTEILGLHNLRSLGGSSRKETTNASKFKIYDNALHEVRIAFLGTGNSVVFEIFKFIDPPYRGSENQTFDYSRGGFFHIAFTAPQPDVLGEKVLNAGGKRIRETITMYDGDRALYLQDPWGNIIEVLSYSFEQLMANRV